MAEALALGASARSLTSPNPWVGCVLVPAGCSRRFLGATEAVGGRHAEVIALQAAGEAAAGSTLYVTLEPCAHQGRTPPCADALVEAGVARVVVALRDPDPRVAGAGLARLRAGGVEVTVGVGSAVAARSLAAYLKHRRHGRPWVVVKLASTLDGRTAAPDRTSRWITGPEARLDVARLRAESDAVIVGAGTVKSDDPSLTVRGVPGRDPLRVVLGSIPPRARVAPAREYRGPLPALLDSLGAEGVLQVLVEGGARVAAQFHAAGLVDQWVLFVAPAILGGDDGRPLLDGPGASTMADAWRGTVEAVRQVGGDVRIDVLAPEALADLASSRLWPLA